jgi:methylglutamate dehydrogenase subunit D
MLEIAEKPGIRYERKSPLADIAVQGRFGAGKGAPGVTLGVRHPVSIVTLIARKEQAQALSAAMAQHYEAGCPQPGQSAQGRGITLHWCGAEQWYALADDRPEGVLYRELRARLQGLAACSDQSHGRVILSISGARASNVLAKGTPVDLHPRAFGPGQCAVTQMAHVGVHLAQIGPDDFELSLFRGFSESFWEWLTEQAEEFGYLVR